MIESVDDEDDNVVIEGSDLHKALVEMGCTDFECIPVARAGLNNSSNKFSNNIENQTSPKRQWTWEWLKNLRDQWNFRNYFNASAQYHRSKNIQLILELDSLLDDHAINIQTMLQEKSLLNPRQTMTNPLGIIFISMMGVSGLEYKPLKGLGIFTLSSLMFYISRQIYAELSSTRELKKLISLLNNIHHLHKKSLKILKNGYCMKLSQNKPQKRFSNLETVRLKYLQPLCETLLQSMQTMIRVFYHTSRALNDLLPANTSDLMTQLEASAFTISGEVTCERLNEIYYIYILAQSDMVHLLAMLYSENEFTHENNLQVIKIANKIFPTLEKYRQRLTVIIEQYKSCKTAPIRRELRKTGGTRWQDLYMHIELLSRKVQLAYDKINLIIHDLDEIHGRDLDSSDDFVNSLERQMCEIYKEIDTARNFAEFNSLLLGKYVNRSVISEKSVGIACAIADEDLPIVRDTEPQIMDEVFEEYVKEEYLKPLCEEVDLELTERVKLDKLLEKNFMSELKEVLIDKYHAMAEREARALSRYRKNVDEAREGRKNVDNQEVIIPCPPALPNMTNTASSLEEKIFKNRPPVPLPRLRNLDHNSRVVEPNLRVNFLHKCPETFESQDNDKDDNCQRFSLGVVMNNGKFPVFTRDEETFTGSGENSEEEINADED